MFRSAAIPLALLATTALAAEPVKMNMPPAEIMAVLVCAPEYMPVVDLVGDQIKITTPRIKEAKIETCSTVTVSGWEVAAHGTGSYEDATKSSLTPSASFKEGALMLPNPPKSVDVRPVLVGKDGTKSSGVIVTLSGAAPQASAPAAAAAPAKPAEAAKAPPAKAAEKAAPAAPAK